MKIAPNLRSHPRRATWKASVLALFAVAVSSSGAHAALVAPVLTVNSSTITKEPRLLKPEYHLTESSDSTIDGEGFSRERETASAWYKATSSHSGGSRSVDNVYAFDSTHRHRALQTTNSYRFDATTAITSTLDSSVGIFNGDHFFFIVDAPYSTALDLRRTIRFTVDQPMQLQIQFAGDTSNANASFKNMFNILHLSGGGFGLAEYLCLFTGTNYKATDSTIFASSGTKFGVNYNLNGIADDSGINLMVDLSPAVEGVAADMQFRWTLQHTLDGGIGASAYSWDKVVVADAWINESVRIVAVPESSALALAAVGFAFACGRRRRS